MHTMSCAARTKRRQRSVSKVRAHEDYCGKRASDSGEDGEKVETMGEEGLGRKMMNEGTQRSGAHLDEEEQLGASGGEGAVHVPLPVQLAGGLS
jgi:hypothetical protein